MQSSTDRNSFSASMFNAFIKTAQLTSLFTVALLTIVTVGTLCQHRNYINRSIVRILWKHIYYLLVALCWLAFLTQTGPNFFMSRILITGFCPSMFVYLFSKSWLWWVAQKMFFQQLTPLNQPFWTFTHRSTSGIWSATTWWHNASEAMFDRCGCGTTDACSKIINNVGFVIKRVVSRSCIETRIMPTGRQWPDLSTHLGSWRQCCFLLRRMTNRPNV